MPLNETIEFRDKLKDQMGIATDAVIVNQLLPQRFTSDDCELIEGKRICICAGAGGVGKTTTSAAIAMGMAARGLKVAVLTIDPAKRLANSLGLPKLGNEERMIDPAL